MIFMHVKFLTTVKNLLMSRNNNSRQERKNGNNERHQSLVSVHKRHVFIQFGSEIRHVSTKNSTNLQAKT